MGSLLNYIDHRRARRLVTTYYLLLTTSGCRATLKLEVESLKLDASYFLLELLLIHA